jgi:hypothetical protein
MSITGTTVNVAKQYPIFVQMATFTKAWGNHGLADEALKALEDEILLNPSVGKVIHGTGGLRKMRFAAPGSQRGKSGGFRVCYVDFTEFGFIFLIAIYTHKEKDDLSPDEKRAAAFIGSTRKGFKQRKTT